jgi:S-DNA-T family DNA segregation ATPase FtsK/SpoIIIE
MNRLVKDIVGLFLLFWTAFLFLALISYNPADPSFSHYTLSIPSKIHNLGGILGAVLSDLLIQTFGFISYVLVGLFGLLGVFLLKSSRSISSRRFFGLFLAVISLTLLFGLLGIGGLVGDNLSALLVKYLNYAGSWLLCSFLLLVSLLFLSRLSLLDFSGFFFKLRGLTSISFLKKRGEKREFRRIKSQELPVILQPPFKELSPSESPREELKRDEGKRIGAWVLPPLDLLNGGKRERVSLSEQELWATAQRLENKLRDFGVEGKVVQVRPGPVVTVYEFEPAPGVKISRVVNLEDDLALALSAYSVRIEAPIPGRSVIGIEVSNRVRESVYLKDVLGSEAFRSSPSKLTLALGKDIEGKPFVIDLTKMPHLLVAGSTGSGKSVSMNCMILSILYRATPDEVKFLLIDPKMLELTLYEEIPHLLLPVVTDPKEAASALKWVVREMENRYALMASKGTKHIERYNQRALEEGEKALPYIVVMIDELADLMITSRREVEESIIRLAQMARAAGIHLVLATQRPSVDVITGIIKANFPARISFQVSSKVDSRTILDTTGAEHLLGQGDMLFLPPGSSRLKRVHGAYASEEEIKRVVKFWKDQGKPEYNLNILKEGPEGPPEEYPDYDDPKYEEAVNYVIQTGQASVSALQRRFKIGYNRAARLIERMEKEGIVGPSDGVRPREVLVKSWKRPKDL